MNRKFSPFATFGTVATLAVVATLIFAGSANGQLNPPPESNAAVADNDVYRLWVRQTGQEAGTWFVETNPDGTYWPGAEWYRELTGADGPTGARTFNSALAVWSKSGGSFYTNNYDPEKSASHDPLPQPDVAVIDGPDGDGEMDTIETSWTIEYDGGNTEITQTIHLADQGLAPSKAKDSYIHLSYQMCNNHPQYTDYLMVRSLVDIQTGFAANPSEHRDILASGPTTAWDATSYFREDGAPRDFSNIHAVEFVNASQWDDRYTMYAMVNEWPDPLKGPEVTTPSRMYVWELDDLQENDFDWPNPHPTPPAYQDAAVAYHWGHQDDANSLVVLQPAECKTVQTYLSHNKTALMIPPPNVDNPPVAIIDITEPEPQSCQNSMFVFNGVTSHDGDGGKPILLRWNFDHPSGQSIVWPPATMSNDWKIQNYRKEMTFPQAGAWNVTLRVWDDALQEGISTVVGVDSIGDPNCPPEVQDPPNLAGEMQNLETEFGWTEMIVANAQSYESLIDLKFPITDFEGDKTICDLYGDRLGAYKMDRINCRFLWNVNPSECGLYIFRVVVSDSPAKNQVPKNFAISNDCGALGEIEQVDRDYDGVADGVDNCYLVPNRDQNDSDLDGIGDACDFEYTAPPQSEKLQRIGFYTHDGKVSCEIWRDGDQDGDGIADPCDTDIDGDMVVQTGEGVKLDNCPFVSNPAQEDADQDGIGDACDPTRGFGFQTLHQQFLAGECPDCLVPNADTHLKETDSETVEAGDIGWIAIGAGLVILGLAVATIILVIRRN